MGWRSGLGVILIGCGCTSLFGSWRSNLAVFELSVISAKSIGGPKSCYEDFHVLHSATDHSM